MVLAMVNEAARCLEERIVATAALVDLAMIMGTGFPPFRGGLLRHADTLGLPSVVERLRGLEKEHGARFAPCELLVRMSQERARFRVEFAG
jgi:3-hydroxyacyl-CoA dehydrogenase/enoyl-CoA hydratase/3-hydroxybutyryl-CoA epimerase